MPEYNILIPCTMSISVGVEAENEEEAKNKALDVDLRVKLESDDPMGPEIYEFETHRQICQGNIYYGCINEIDVQEA